MYTPSGLLYRHADWLGSARLVTTPSQTVVGDVAYAPFGETYASSGTPFLSFTGMDQDTVGNEYDFPAREYGIQGRWPSPDPGGLGSVNAADPQSWNRYAYVDNNPLAVTDPSGMGPEGGVIGPLCATNPVACVVAGIFEGLLTLLFHHHHHHHNAPPHAKPAPPGGYGGGIDPFGGDCLWCELPPQIPSVGLPRIGIPGVQVGPNGCDFIECGLSSGDSLYPSHFPLRHHKLSPDSWLNPYFWRGILDSIGSRNAEVAQNQRLMEEMSPEVAACLAKKNLPIGLYTAASQGTDWALGKVLARIGLTGVEEAAPLAAAGTFAGSVVGCAKELAPAGGPK
jgi:RHS repeat-associated protein